MGASRTGRLFSCAAIAALLAGPGLITGVHAQDMPSAPLEDLLPLEWAPPGGEQPAGIATRATAAPPTEPTANAEELIPLDWAPPALDGVIAGEQVRQAVADMLAAADHGGLPPAMTERPDFKALAEAYAARDNRPVWIEHGAFGERARAAIARIARADEDGLEPAAFQLPSPAGAAVADMARAELELSLAAVSYARQAAAGRLDPSSISGFISAEPVAPEPGDILASLAVADDAAAVLDAYNPPHEGFRALRRELAAVRAARPAAPMPEIAEGRLLRPGMHDPRVPALRARLGVAAPVPEAHPDWDRYDDTLAEAVRAYQRDEGLNDEAIVGKLTRNALNEGRGRDVESDLLVNMERWRWMPRDFGDDHVIVNTPEYMVRVVSNGVTTHEARVVVGTIKTQTPVFSDAMEYLVVNPSWGVPLSIVKRDMLPRLQNDPYYLARRGIDVHVVHKGRSRMIDSSMVDWTRTDLRGLHFRQPPGVNNALGRIKFMFPNEHAVYLHDTPTRNLFGRTARAYSNGCVRVEDPFALAEAILSISGGMDIDRVKRMVGGGEKRINLTTPLPVHLVYFTTWVDEAGEVQHRPDVYGHDGRMRAALGLGA